MFPFRSAICSALLVDIKIFHGRAGLPLSWTVLHTRTFICYIATRRALLFFLHATTHPFFKPSSLQPPRRDRLKDFFLPLAFLIL